MRSAMKCARKIVSVIGLVQLCACDRLPDRVRVTPELTGRVTRSGTPVANASIVVVRRPDVEGRAAACSDPLASSRSDGAGAFRARSFRSWISSARLLRDDVAENEQFQLCVRPEDSSEYQLMFRTAANRWDTLEVECDLDRVWLSPDKQGSAGRCVVRRFAVDSQRLSQRPTRSPALTCDTTTTLIEPLRLGPIRVNGSVAELKRLCPGVRDTVVKLAGLYAPGVERAHVMNVAGQALVIRKNSGVITDIIVTSPVFRTREGFGVGVPVTRLLEEPMLRVVTSSEHHGPWVFAWHGRDCGLGYSVARPTYDMRDRIGLPIPLHRLREWPAPTSIRAVYVGFCPERQFARLLR